MKTVLVILVFFGGLSTICYSQTDTLTKVGHYYSLSNCNSSGYVYIVRLANGGVIQTEYLLINSSQIDSMVTLSRIETITKYGVITGSGSFIVKPSKNLKLITINDIFQIFNISDDLKHCPIFIDDALVYRPETIIAARDQISEVKVIADSGNKNQVINIITRGYDWLKSYQREHPKSQLVDYSKFYLNSLERVELDAYLNSK